MSMAFANPPDVSQKDPKRRDPHLKGHILPVYPIQEAGNIHGDVYLWVNVDRKGQVSRVEIISGPEVFHDAAIETAQITF